MSRPRNLQAEGLSSQRRLDVAQSDWFSAAPENEGIAFYLTVLRSKLWVIAVTVVVCVGVAALVLVQSQKVYQSGADLLITPVPSGDTTLIGLGLTSESSDPTRDIETIARLIKTQAIASRVVSQLHLTYSPQHLLKNIDATPVASSNVVTVTARANDPNEAARIANAFATASVAERTATLHRQLDILIPRLQQQILHVSPASPDVRTALVQQLEELQSLQGLNDPTIRLEVPAQPNPSAISPRPALTLAAAIIAGLFIGTAAVFGSQLYDPRLRSEDQLRRYRIPVLVRVPLDKQARGRQKEAPLLPAAVSPVTHDSYSLLAATLAGDQMGSVKRSVFFTGPSSGDGKTTSALNLATSISGSHVILVEGDSRRPTIGRAFGLRPKHGLSGVLSGRVPLGDALMNVGTVAPRLRLLVQAPSEPPLGSVATPVSADRLIRDAHMLADWLVIDAPPLTFVPETLLLAKQVDAVVLVVRLGNTRLKQLAELAELLAQQDITPVGFVLVGGKSANAYYGY